MKISIVIALACIAFGACKRDDRAPAPAPAPAAAPVQPKRIAAEDEDLRVLLAELASSRACEMIRGQYRPLRAADRPGTVTGTLWIRGCKITQQGTKVTFHLTGTGWQWADQTKDKVGGTFSLRQYVRFDVDATIPGALDIAYARKAHIVTVWFSPSELPTVKFTPTGELDVDAEGAWSTIVGAIGGVFGQGPEDLAEKDAKAQGAQQFQNQFADGLSVTIDLCTGLPRFGLGRPAQGKMVTADAGESRKVPVEVQPGGLQVFGPYLAPRGMTVRAHARDGAVRLEVACQDEAAKLSEAYAKTGDASMELLALGKTDVRGEATLQVKSPKCDLVAVIARPIGDRTATFDWHRPVTEAAKAAGGPLIDCD